jgi:flagellar biosynthesis protein FlhF
LGVKPGFAQALAAGLNPSAALEQAWEQALQGFARAIPTAPEDVINEGGMVALVGSTGVGKTTTVAKLAARYALRHGARKVALVTTDSYRIGAHEQLLTYGRILGVPVQVATDHAELQRSLRSLMDKHLVLIDTAGMSQRDMRLSEQFATLRQTGMPIRCCLVVSATAQGSIQEETIKAFRGIDLDGCILTKVDETASLGSALSVISEQQLPLAYVCDGQRVPEDLQPVRPLDLVRRAAELSGRDEWTPADAVLAERFGGAAAHAHV